MSNRVKEIRTKRGMSVSELARRTGLSRTAIYTIENGESNPFASTIYKISKALDGNPNAIFFSLNVIRE